LQFLHHQKIIEICIGTYNIIFKSQRNQHTKKKFDCFFVINIIIIKFLLLK
jgi:hypothetical protein